MEVCRTTDYYEVWILVDSASLMRKRGSRGPELAKSMARFISLTGMDVASESIDFTSRTSFTIG